MNDLWRPTEALMDYYVWAFLQWYYMPAYLMGQGSEVDKWVSSFSTNGLKMFDLTSNLCQPQRR